MGRKKTRFYAIWRADADYVAQLGPKERRWLAKFEAEYYRADFGEDPLHTRRAHREEIFDRQNAGARDVVTAKDEDVAHALTRTIDPRPCHQVRHYQPSDYRMFGRGAIAGADELEQAALDGRLREFFQIIDSTEKIHKVPLLLKRAG